MRAVAVAPAVAEVDAARQLADDQQVGAGDQFGPQGAGVHERGAGADRAQVGVEAETPAQPEQALLGPRRVGVGGIPLRPADGTEQDGVRAPAGLQHLVGQRRPVGVDGGAAGQVLAELELVDRLQQAARRGNDLRADPVAGQQGDRSLCSPRGG